jgi:hypothetical protein
MVKVDNVIREVGRMEDELDLNEVIAVAIRRKMELAVMRKEQEMIAERLADGERAVACCCWDWGSRQHATAIFD